MSVAVQILRRCAIAVALLFCLTFLTFALYNLMPIDPACVVVTCDQKPMPSSERNMIHHAIGVDRPFTTQYVDWAEHVVHGDFGTAWHGMLIDPGAGSYGTSVNSMIVPALWRSLSIVFGGLLLLMLIAIPISLVAASRPGSWFDRLTSGFLLIGIAMHPLVVGLTLQSLSFRWRFIPTGTYCPIHAPASAAGAPGGCSGVANWAWHLLLPCLTFAVLFAALYVRVLRTTLIDVLRQPYIATARAKGAGEVRVHVKHALRNALRPILTMSAMEAGMAVTALLYIEVVFGINGLGSLSLTAFSGDTGYDLPVIAALVLVIGIGIIGLNLVVDLLYPLIDPRVGIGQSRRALVARPSA
jgi:peptide/nickel transport system permease protein